LRTVLWEGSTHFPKNLFDLTCVMRKILLLGNRPRNLVCTILRCEMFAGLLDVVIVLGNLLPNAYEDAAFVLWNVAGY
jgi:hypothetical protein